MIDVSVYIIYINKETAWWNDTISTIMHQQTHQQSIYSLILLLCFFFIIIDWDGESGKEKNKAAQCLSTNKHTLH